MTASSFFAVSFAAIMVAGWGGMMIKKFIQRWQERLLRGRGVINDELGPTIGVGNFVAQVAGWSVQNTFVIPVGFIVISWMGTQLISSNAADHIVTVLSRFIPDLKQHYSVLNDLGRAQDAANYALFYVVMLAASATTIIKTSILYFLIHLRFRSAGKNEALFIVAGLVGLVIIELGLDPAQTKPGSLINMRFDAYGLFYIRQWCFFAFFQFCLSMMLITGFYFLRRNSDYRSSSL